MRRKVVLACSVCKSRNYITEKNKDLQGSRIEMKKFCKVCHKHVLHLETK